MKPLTKEVLKQLEIIKLRVAEKRMQTKNENSKERECTQYCVRMSRKVHEWYHEEK